MAATDTVRVTVREGWLVVDPATGEQTGGGSTLDVAPELAERWTRSGWVEPAPEPPAKRGK